VHPGSQTEVDRLQEELAFHARQSEQEEKTIRTLRADLAAAEEGQRVRACGLTQMSPGAGGGLISISAASPLAVLIARLPMRGSSSCRRTCGCSRSSAATASRRPSRRWPSCASPWRRPRPTATGWCVHHRCAPVAKAVVLTGRAPGLQIALHQLTACAAAKERAASLQAEVERVQRDLALEAVRALALPPLRSQGCG